MSNWQLDLEGIELIEWNNNLSRDKMNHNLNRIEILIFFCYIIFMLIFVLEPTTLPCTPYLEKFIVLFSMRRRLLRYSRMLKEDRSR